MRPTHGREASSLLGEESASVGRLDLAMPDLATTPVPVSINRDGRPRAATTGDHTRILSSGILAALSRPVPL